MHTKNLGNSERVEMTFPRVSGSNLLRQKLTLSQDFQGRLNLVFIPFERWHQNIGMRAGIPNPKTRERTITLYIDKADFRAALGLPDEEHIYILVVDRQGKEFFRGRGPYSREVEAALRQALSQLTPQ
jgi:hypothetical protein